MMLIQSLVYIILPISIMFYGAVETRIHVPIYLLIGLMTLATILKQAKEHKFPRINKFILYVLALLSVIFALQCLMAFFNSTQSVGSLAQSPVFIHHPLFSLGSVDLHRTLTSISKGTFCISWAYLFLCNFQTLKQKIQFLTVYCFIGFFISLFAILKIPMHNLDALNVPFLQEGFGPFINKNHFAGYLETTIPACIGLIFLSDSKSKKNLGIFFVIIMVMALLLSFSRMGVFSLFTAIFLTGFLFYKKGKFSLNLKWILPTLALLACLLTWIGTEGMYERYKSILNVSDNPHNFARITYMKEALPMVMDYPFLGTGLGAYNSVFPEYKQSPQQIFVDYLHNDIVQYLIEVGIPAFFLSLVLVFYLIKKVYQTIPIYNKQALGLCFAGIGAFLALGIHSLFDYNLHIPSNALCFLAILFLPISLESRVKVKPSFSFFIVIISGIILTAAGIQLWKELSYERNLDSAQEEVSAEIRIKKLESLTKKFPNISDAHYQVGKVKFYNAIALNNMEQLKESITHINHAIKLNPNEAKAYLRAGIARYYYAVSSENIDHEKVMENAISDLETAVLKNRTSALMWYYYGYYSVKKWYDYSEVADDAYIEGIKSWTRSIYLDPSYAPRLYKNLFEMFDDYKTLTIPTQSIISNQENKRHKIRSTGALHFYFSKFLREHKNELSFPESTAEDIKYSRTVFSQAEEYYKKEDFQSAWSSFEEILTKNTDREMLINTHRYIGRCTYKYLMQKYGNH